MRQTFRQKLLKTKRHASTCLKLSKTTMTTIQNKKQSVKKQDWAIRYLAIKSDLKKQLAKNKQMTSVAHCYSLLLLHELDKLMLELGINGYEEENI